jgi:hypothetical protein
MSSLISSAIASMSAKKSQYLADIKFASNTKELSVKVTGWNPQIGKWEGTSGGNLVRFDSTSSTGLREGQVVTVTRPSGSQIGFSSHS